MTSDFERWVDALFGPRASDDEGWPPAAMRESWPSHRERVLNFIRLCGSPSTWLAHYDDETLGAALYGGSHFMFSLYRDSEADYSDPTDPAGWSLRQEGIRAIPDFFRGVFAARLGDALSLDSAGNFKLAGACFMFWDIWWYDRWAFLPDELTVLAEAVDAMERCLYLGSLACCESAVHGLKHAQELIPAAGEALIRFGASGVVMPADLKRYFDRPRVP